MLFRLLIVLIVLGSSTIPWSTVAQDSPDPEATIEALQTEVARLEGEIATATPSVVATPEDQPQEMAPASDSDESTLPHTVNLEIILDDSGSMGQIIDTGESRLDAAKRVLNEVIAAIPDEPGINVGLRIYGHEGDNTDAGRPVSCQASDLVVPISGVDQTAIAQQIAPLVPTGWTPIGLSLERSEADFPASEEVESTNAVVLVTDGLETCDGDPAAAAAALVSSDKAIVTHVIGFALAPEEQQILESITDASGGMLLGATNATELTGALFTILDELEVVKGVGLIGGSALSLLPPGEPGGFSIVAMGAYDGNILPFVVRNNTGEPMVSLSATGHARNPADQLIATGDDHNLNPNLVRPGGLSLGYIYFGGADLPPDTTFTIEVEGIPAAEEAFESQRDLEVVEAAFVDGRVVGTLRNGYDEPLNGPFRVQLGCFDQAGALIALERDYAPEDDAEPGETVTFQAPGFGTLDCPLFLVAGSGSSRSFDRQHKASDILTPESGQSPSPQAPTDAGATPAAEDSAARANELALPGISGGVARLFILGGVDEAHSGSTSYIAGTVLELDLTKPIQVIAESARAVGAELGRLTGRDSLTRLGATTSWGDTQETSVPVIGDWTQAYVATTMDSQYSLAMLIFGQDPYVYVLIGVGEVADPLTDLTDVAYRLTGLAPLGANPVVEAGYRTDGLWGMLPRVEHLGPGFLFDHEWVTVEGPAVSG